MGRRFLSVKLAVLQSHRREWLPPNGAAKKKNGRGRRESMINIIRNRLAQRLYSNLCAFRALVFGNKVAKVPLFVARNGVEAIFQSKIEMKVLGSDFHVTNDG